MDRDRHSRGPRPARQSRSAAARFRALALYGGVLGLAALSAGAASPDLGIDPDSVRAASAAAGRDVLPAPAHPFRPGESLRFSVQYGPIHAGSAWLEVHGDGERNGHTIDTLVARAESNSFFSLTFKVRNRIESVWDADERCSNRYVEDRREGGFRARNDITFDQQHGEARYSDGRIFPIPPRVQDALSSFYYTRFQALPVGGSVVFDYHASRRSQPLEVRVLGRDRIHVPAGTFDCVIVEPVLKAGGIFKHSGRLLIWLTADDRRVPVLMKSKVAIGSISVILQNMKSGA
ncbi:MAG TPA: DUF3108 domain-containing protein [Candidatus Udaeobacter sp.]|jgi:hypothetical protein|nr:DUF3108 domain-containing protein [Candidatus Udaeobacter sp.]